MREEGLSWDPGISLGILLYIVFVIILKLLVVGPYLSPVEQDVQLNASDNGRQIDLLYWSYTNEYGDTFERRQNLVITLDGATGCYWRIAELDIDILHKVGESQRYGTPGITLRFEAVSIGNTPLKLVCRPPPDIEPMKNFSIQVAVHEYD
ncbi:MAG TPA: protease inhibitor I42 family protein [candidate division Zixibacteria bacterium]|nr:protease inhibitor I42 family protein [candidate division Zixibacteria bacterium]